MKKKLSFTFGFILLAACFAMQSGNYRSQCAIACGGDTNILFKGAFACGGDTNIVFNGAFACGGDTNSVFLSSAVLLASR